MASSCSAWLWWSVQPEGENPQGGELGLDPASIQFVQSSRTGSALVCRSTATPGSPGSELSPVLCS